MIRRVLSMIAPIAVCLAASGPVCAQLVVGTCISGTSYPTISKAVAAAKANATIQVCPGNYPEQVVINKPLTLTGVTSSQIFSTTTLSAVVVPPATGVQQNTTDLEFSTPIAAQILVTNTSNVTLSNFAVDGTNNGLNSCAIDLQGIYFQNASGRIDHMVVRNQALSTALNGCQAGEGIYIEAKSLNGANVQVTNSSVHGYQKNGVTVEATGASATIQNNVIAGQGPTTGAGENGIQVSDGAAATVSGNTVSENVYIGPFYGASGILVYGSQNVSISGNIVNNNQLPIILVSDPTDPSANNPQGKADGAIITGNSISNSNFGDGIDACSNHNTITGNFITNTLVSGIHLDSICGTPSAPTGISNIVLSNGINESCAGLLVPASGPNTISLNTVTNVKVASLAGNSCPAATSAVTAAVTSAAPPVPVAISGLPVSRR